MSITITPLPKSQPLINNWFEKGLEAFKIEINRRIHPCNNGGNDNSRKVKLEGPNGHGKKIFCGDCCIEFFYFYDGALANVLAYKNAIWIKVHNINNLNIWIRVGFNEKGKKKAQLYSKNPINCMILENAPAYALPKLFTPDGIWMSDRGLRVINAEWSEIIDKICNLLKCACIATEV